jgi:hypothetical protein
VLTSYLTATANIAASVIVAGKGTMLIDVELHGASPPVVRPEPVTNQVTTSPAHTGRLRSLPDGRPGLTCMGLTISDHARRIRQAWHARGQGFESP